jgi:hypothetical protein
MKDPSLVFDPFYSTKPVNKGNGLGLSICYGIIQEHGGLISAYNRPEGGATFRVELPAVATALPKPAAHLPAAVSPALPLNAASAPAVSAPAAEPTLLPSRLAKPPALVVPATPTGTLISPQFSAALPAAPVAPPAQPEPTPPPPSPLAPIKSS